MAEIKRDWKIGDKFRVRSRGEIEIELNDDNETNGISWVEQMWKFCNKKYEVKRIYNETSVGAETEPNNGMWSFAYEWIEPVAKYPWSKYVSVE